MTTPTPRTAMTSDDIRPGPFSEDDLRRAWNQQSDDLNQWDSLGSDEQLAWAQVQAIDADRARAALKAEPEGESPRPDGDWFAVALVAQDMRSRGLAEQLTGEELLKLANKQRLQPGNPATPPAPAAPVDDGPVAVALIEAESALADVAEGEAVSPRADGCLHWAEARCTEALAAIRPVMRRHGIQTSEFPPAAAPAPGENLATALGEADMDHVERLAAIIRKVDGNHSIGAAALAKAILERYPCAFLDAQHAAQSRWGDGLMAGVCVALAVVTAHDDATTWGEIVKSAGINNALNYAANVNSEEWELAGFGKYAQSELGQGKPYPAPQAGEVEA
jgi:hypothetical protein